MFEAGAPGVAVELVKDGDNAGGDEFGVDGLDDLENVKADGIAAIGGIKIANIVDPVGGDEVQEDFAKITVRVDDSDTFAFFEVINGHVGDEGGFTGAGFTDNVKMAPAIGGFEAESGEAVFKLGPANKTDFFFLLVGEVGGDGKVFRGFGEDGSTPGDIGDLDVFAGKVPESGKFVQREDLGAGNEFLTPIQKGQ